MRVYIDRLWRRAKSPFAVPLGPVQLLVSVRRAIKISNNRRRGKLHARIVQEHASHSKQDAVLPTLNSQGAPASATGVAVIVGAGPGFGYGVATRLAEAGLRVALVSRNAERHDLLVAKLHTKNPWVRAYGCDATVEGSVVDMLRCVTDDFGIPTLIVYAVQEGGRSTFLDADVAAFEHAWRANCLGAFIVAKHAARIMAERECGTIVLVGATSGLLGRAGYVNFAPGKFGLRAVSQVAARELGPQGIHVGHCH